jgi:hypothetical protein
MNRFALLVLGLSALFATEATGQRRATGPIHASVAREAASLAATSAVRNRKADRPYWVSQTAVRSGRSDDWDAVQQLGRDTRVVISTARDQSIRGRVAAVVDGTLQMVDREGNDRSFGREDVREVRLDHRFSTAQYVGLGVLVGGGAGLALGHASECDGCELQGLGTAMGAIVGTVGGLLGGWMIGSGINAQPGRLIYRQPGF